MTPSPSNTRTRLARLLRTLLDTAAVVSLVLLIAVLGLWIDSYWWAREVVVTSPITHGRSKGGYRNYRLQFESGGISFFLYPSPAMEGREFYGRHWSCDLGSWPAYKHPKPFNEDLDLSFAGVSIHRDRDGDPYAVVFPLWLLALALVPLPLWRGMRWRKRRRARRRARLGLCPQCGYDLRASPERCPECGAERK